MTDLHAHPRRPAHEPSVRPTTVDGRSPAGMAVADGPRPGSSTLARRLDEHVLPPAEQEQYPWSCTGRVDAMHPDGGGWQRAGSGVLVGPNLLLTAAHLFKDRPFGDGWRFRFVPVYDDGPHPADPTGGALVWAELTGQYVAGSPSGNFDPSGLHNNVYGWDLIICELALDLGHRWGWVGVVAGGGSYYRSVRWTSVGYPTLFDDGERPIRFPGIDIDDVETDDNDSKEIETEDYTFGDFFGEAVGIGPLRGWSGGALLADTLGGWRAAGVLSGRDADDVLDSDGVLVFAGGDRLLAAHAEAYRRFLPNPNLLFYDRPTGRWSTGKLTDDGWFRTQQISPPGAFARWSRIVSVGGGTVLFHEPTRGQWSTGHLPPEGGFVTLRVSEPGAWSPWTHIAAAGNGAVLTYDHDTGQWTTAVVDDAGDVHTTFVSEPGSFASWTHIVGGGNGAILTYSQHRGQFTTATLSPAGELRTVTISDHHAFAQWTHVTGLGDGLILTYHADTGRWATGRLDPDGGYRTLVVSDPGSFAPWTHLVGAGNGTLLTYDRRDGRWTSAVVDDDGHVRTTEISQPGSFGAWTNIIGPFT